MSRRHGEPARLSGFMPQSTNAGSVQYELRDKGPSQVSHSLVELRALWDKGQLRSTSNVRVVGSAEWDTLAQVIDRNVETVVPEATAPAPAPARDLVKDEIAGILVRGGQIAAIKRYRALTGCDLLPAKNYVHALSLPVPPATATPVPDDPVKAEIARILAKDGDLPAIWKYRQITGCDYPTGETYINSLRTANYPAKTVPKKAGSGNPANSFSMMVILGIVTLCMGLFIYHLLFPAPPPPLTTEEQKYGRKPEVAESHDSRGYIYVQGVESYLKDHAKDPSSLEIIAYGTDLVPFQGADGVCGWRISVRYRAKNSFGGYGVEEAVLLIRDGSVVNMAKP